MREYVIRRLILVVPGLIVLTILVFGMVRLIPGDVVQIIAIQLSGGRGGGEVSPEVKAKLRRDLGLDKPIYIQYFVWMSSIVRGDLGNSLITDFPIVKDLKKRFPITLELVFFTLVLMIVWGLSIGIISAVRQDSWLDYGLRSVAILGLSVPFFWTAILLLLFGSLWLNWSPPFGVNPFFEDPWANIQQFFVPAMILAISQGSQVARMTRATILEVLRQDYVRTARAKGLIERTILVRHTLKNAMIPVVGLIGINFAFALGGTVILEQIWGLPGMGQLMLTAIKNRDYPVIQGVILFTGVLVMLVNLLVDISYGWLNPRIHYQ
ncbi:MAG: ABC transporter permease [Chloroflexi bacterium]|nr:ABC transporter permease [Chloroflexota bacterium]